LKTVLIEYIIISKIRKEVARISTDNPLKAARERLMIGRSELARKAGVALITVERIERGRSCRLDSKRKIVEALGFNPWLDRNPPSSPER
jgi:DNA-binding XRE family transcriptional regulator